MERVKQELLDPHAAESEKSSHKSMKLWLLNHLNQSLIPP